MTSSTDPSGPSSLAITSIKRMHAARASRSLPTPSMGQVIWRRLNTFEKIRSAHEADGAMWAGMVRVDPHQIARQKSDKPLSVEKLFVLGLSCSRLLTLKTAPELCRSILLLLEEFDIRFSGHRDIVPSSLSKPLDYRQHLSASSGQNASNKVSVARLGKKFVFECLVNTNIPCDLDYTFTVVNLCDILSLLYARFRDFSIPEDSFNKIDERMRDIVIAPILHRLKHCSYEQIDQEIRKVKYRFKLSRTSAHRATVAGSGDGIEEEEPDFKKIFQV